MGFMVLIRVPCYPAAMVATAKLLFFLMIVLLAAALGAVAMFFGSILFGVLTGATMREGALAMGAAGLAPFGALAGAGLGAWFGWRALSRMSDGAAKAAGFGLAAVPVLGLGVWFAFEELTDGDPYPPDKEPLVLIEWRLPESFPHDRVGRVFRHTMRSSYMNWTLSTQWDTPRARDEDGKTVLCLQARIRWRVTGRIFQLWRAPHHDDRITVDAGLPADPPHADDYGPWNSVPGYPGHAFRTRVVRQ